MPDQKLPILKAESEVRALRAGTIVRTRRPVQPAPHLFVLNGSGADTQLGGFLTKLTALDSISPTGPQYDVKWKGLEVVWQPPVPSISAEPLRGEEETPGGLFPFLFGSGKTLERVVADLAIETDRRINAVLEVTDKRIPESITTLHRRNHELHREFTEQLASIQKTADEENVLTYNRIGEAAQSVIDLRREVTEQLAIMQKTANEANAHLARRVSDLEERAKPPETFLDVSKLTEAILRPGQGGDLDAGPLNVDPVELRLRRAAMMAPTAQEAREAFVQTLRVKREAREELLEELRSVIDSANTQHVRKLTDAGDGVRTVWLTLVIPVDAPPAVHEAVDSLVVGK